jgi:hypothetical protein
MLPHGHLAVGYLLASAVLRRRDRSLRRRELLALVVSTQLPDLIDKPLAVAVGGVFAGGRTVGHSLLFLVPALVVLGARRHNQPGPVALAAVGTLSHPPLDAAVFLLQGTVVRDLVEVSFLFWPAGLPAGGIVRWLERLPVLGEAVAAKPGWTARHLPSGGRLSWYVRVTELVLASAATVRWLADGAPGLDAVTDR